MYDHFGFFFYQDLKTFSTVTSHSVPFYSFHNLLSFWISQDFVSMSLIGRVYWVTFDVTLYQMSRASSTGFLVFQSNTFVMKTVRFTIRVITKLPNSEQSSKGKVKTHKYINRQNQSTTGKLWKPWWSWLGTGISKEMVGWIRF